MLPTTIRPGGPSLSVSSAVATASQPSPHHPRINDRASGTDALQSQERAVASDPKYRKYAQQVEKTLATFEHVNEWADFITFLAKLLKCLQSAPQYPFIPHKLTVAKRLSQCLNPALPTGVHQRALDVYVHILTTIGPDNLRRDLPAWTSGLLPFFQYAATSIKPMVLSIFSRFYLPLQEALRPATKAFILALLPGLDEEASEWFEQVATLLDRLCDTVSPTFFLPNIWLVLITTPHARVSALNYLLRRLHLLDPSGSKDTALPATGVDGERQQATGASAERNAGRDIGLMVRGYAAALEDDQVLVQRSALELLISTLPVSGAAFGGLASDDKVLLIRASLPVVLRRDLSLTRRLHAWLLGASDAPQDQMEYLRKFALESLRTALVEDMTAFEPAADAPWRLPHSSESVAPRRQATTRRQRAFKIFISLLDKWEIGAPLTEVAVMDAFAAVQAISEGPRPSSEETTLTAQLLYDALDPMLLWRQIYRSVQNSFRETAPDATPSPSHCDDTATRDLELVRFVIKTFKIRDEEVQRLYAPVVAFSTIGQIATSRQLNGHLDLSVLSSAASLVQDLLDTTDFESVFNASHAADGDAVPPSPTDAVRLAGELFGRDDNSAPWDGSFDGQVLMLEATLASLDIVQFCCLHRAPAAERAATDDGATGAATDALDALCLTAADIFTRLSGLLSSRLDPGMRATLLLRTHWSPGVWFDSVLQTLQSIPARLENFALHEALVGTALEASRAGWLSVLPHKSKLVAAAAKMLLDYLGPSTAPCYISATDMIWRLDELSPSRLIESLVAERLSSGQAETRSEGFAAFGNLWRCTSDQQLPGQLMTTPMFGVLDGLKAEDLTTRRLAEAWMRCSLKSYLRVLDPLLSVLADPRHLVRMRVEKLGDIRMPVFSYGQAIDSDQLHHALDSLLSLARFGGQGFIRVAKASFLKHSFDPALRQRVLQADLETSTYLDGMVDLLLRFLCATTTPGSARHHNSSEERLHGLAAEILQVLLSRGEADLADLDSIEAALMCRLYTSVYHGHVDLQNKMLHVLHTAVHASRQPFASPRHRTQSEDVGTPAGEVTSGPQLFLPPDLAFEAFFVRLVESALEQEDVAVVHHWLDFLLMTVPRSRYEAPGVLGPVLDGLIMHLRTCVSDVRHMFDPVRSSHTSSVVTDAEFAALVNALERLLLLSLARTSSASSDAVPNGAEAKHTAEGAGASGPSALFGYVTGVLGHADSEVAEPSSRSKHDTQHLTEAVAAILSAWTTSLQLERAPKNPFSETRDHVAVRVRLRSKRALERFLKSHNVATINAIVCYWSAREVDESTDFAPTDDDLAGIIQTILPQPTVLVTCIYEGIDAKPSPAKTSRSSRTVTDQCSLRFLEFYIRQIEPATAVQLWSRSLTFVRDILTNQATSRALMFPATRVFAALCIQISRTRALEDRRMRRDMHETLSRLVENTVQTAGRAPDSSGWLRKGVRDGVLGDDDSAQDDARKEDEKSSVGEMEKPAADRSKAADANQIADFLSEHILPNFDTLQIEPERASAICANIVYYLIAPSMKGRGRHFEVPAPSIRILQQMSQHSAVLKAWKGVVTDALADHRFFQASPSAEPSWRPLVHALTLADRERMPELVAKVSTSSSANIFTNRELEVLSRALALRRLTYTLFCSPKDTSLAQLPAVQEKLVDLLRSPVGDLVHAEVYLCLRVLFCRIDNQHLAGLWPVLLTELLRLFDSLFDHTIAEDSDLLQLVCAACKFIDLTLVLQTEDFQIHEWIFVTDTVDAASSSGVWSSQAIIDRLGDLAARDGEEENIALTAPPADSYRWQGRRPLLSARRITSMVALQPFLRNISVAAYQSLYHAGTRIDWEAVERSLVGDLFDGPETSPHP
ncbi:hypothetical protein JCM8115_004327 [Rhodotorula mucilaginosa]